LLALLLLALLMLALLMLALLLRWELLLRALGNAPPRNEPQSTTA